MGVICLVATKAYSINGNDHVKGEIIIQLSEIGKISSKEQVDRIRTSLSAFGIKRLRFLQTDSKLLVMKIADDEELESAINKLEALPGVVFAEPNYKLKALNSSNSKTGMPNDPMFEKNWSLLNVGQLIRSSKRGKIGADVNVLPLWSQGITGSKKIIVGVIDTGVDWNHEDLKENIYTNPGEAGVLASNGKDDDNNGFVDDVHGWNFQNNTNKSTDDNHHGTHCSGTIGAVGNNGIGIAGVNWNTSILPIKFLDKNGSGDAVDAIEGINYAVKMGAKVLNNSWGGGGYSKALRDAIEKANKKNVIFVAAAGNDGSNNDVSPAYPASYEVANVISVAATNSLDEKASFSNYGLKTVHIAAPGEDIYSTFPNNQYGYLSGTSMAAPHVAGIVALMLSVNPKLTPLEIKESLISSAQLIAELKNFVLAHGRVNVFNAINNKEIGLKKSNQE
jgi:subtilisin family serine protease